MSYARECPRPRVERLEIPWGHAGIDATVEHMRILAHQGAGRQLVQELAAELARNARTTTDVARAIREWLDRSVRFKHDPPGVELIRTPEMLIATVACRGWAEGDCDDVAVLGAALGMAQGLAADYVLLGFHPSEPYEHVYTELRTDSGPVELDTTRPAQMPPDLVIERSERRVV